MSALTPSPSASRDRSRWLPAEELVLKRLKTDKPKATWSELQVLFNAKVDAHRNRTVDAICRKWKLLQQSRLANTAVNSPSSDQHISMEPLPQDLNMDLSVCTYHHHPLGSC